MAKQRDTLASLRKKIAQLEVTIRTLEETITAYSKRVAECADEKSILVKTISQLTCTTPHD